MRGLICKDFFVMKKQLGYYLAFFVVYGVLAVTGVFPASILSALVAVIAMMVPMSSIAYDDQAHWGRYARRHPRRSERRGGGQIPLYAAGPGSLRPSW